MIVNMNIGVLVTFLLVCTFVFVFKYDTRLLECYFSFGDEVACNRLVVGNRQGRLCLQRRPKLNLYILI